MKKCKVFARQLGVDFDTHAGMNRVSVVKRIYTTLERRRLISYGVVKQKEFIEWYTKDLFMDKPDPLKTYYTLLLPREKKDLLENGGAYRDACKEIAKYLGTSCNNAGAAKELPNTLKGGVIKLVKDSRTWKGNDGMAREGMVNGETTDKRGVKFWQVKLKVTKIID